MEQDVPLTALCAICHVNNIKYTCPRCSIHTCSLPCVKRHKQFAQCSGIRDPAAYRKRADLATPASIDQDFNFITKVERSLQRADDEVYDRGIHLTPVGVNKYGGQHKTKFEQEVQARGIKLIRAPEGLSRRKLNKSGWKAGTLMWTVEWRPFNADVRVQNVAESKTVLKTFMGHYGRNVPTRKRKRDEQDGVLRAQSDAARLERPEGSEKHTAGAGTASPLPDASSDAPIALPPDLLAGAEATSRNNDEIQEKLGALHFYLHRPQTSSKIKCLIPINPDSTWKEVLKGRTLVEFPSVYVLEEAPEELSAPFILEQDYLQNHGEDVVPIPAAVSESRDGSAAPPSTLDSAKILEVLKQDLKR